MIKTWKRLLAYMMVILLLCGNFSFAIKGSEIPTTSAGAEVLTSDKNLEDYQKKDTKDNSKHTAEEKKEGIQSEESGEAEATEKGQESTEEKNKEESSTVTDYEETEKSTEDEENSEDSSEEKKEISTEESSTENSTETSKETDSERAEDSSEKAPEEESTEVSTEVSTESSTQAEETTTESTEEEPEDLFLEEEELQAFSTLGPHDIDMPDVTSHYFTLQKNSKKVSSASGTYLKVVKDVKSASNYIYKEMTDGKEHNFIPRMTSSTSVTVSGGSGGGVSFSTVKASSRDEFGDVYNFVNNGSVQSKVFNLSKCTSNPQALYTNVGTWYDKKKKITSSVDMKLEITGHLFPSEKIRKQQSNVYKAPYIGFCKSKIGIVTMGSDYLQTSMTFYYHGTQNKISDLKGVIQFCDIDAQQGVDFGSGFQKIIMFNTSGSHLQYNSTGLISSSKGYVSSRVVTNMNAGDTTTTALGVFSGASVSCRWTVAKCDHKDTGGSAAYAAKGGFGIPADSSQKDSISYYYSNSTGFLGITTDLGLIALPEDVDKNEYTGGVDASKSREKQRELKLNDRSDTVTFVLSTDAAAPSDIKKAYYSSFTFEDHLEALFALNSDVKVYTEESAGASTFKNVTSSFTITSKEEADHKTFVKVDAKGDSLKKSGFYGKTYFVHIPVRIRTEAELKAKGLSISNWYQKDNHIGSEVSSSQSYLGMMAADNKTKLIVASNQGITENLESEEVAIRIPMSIVVRKYGSSANVPVAGVIFGLFGGSAANYKTTDQPIMTATSDKDGYLCFQKDTFYQAKYGDGPYHIREISVPDTYKNVWTSAGKSWAYTISSLKTANLYEKIQEQKTLVTATNQTYRGQILWNTPYNNPKNKVKVYKESKETRERLKGALFVLYQWSVSKNSYVKLMNLTEGEDSNHQPYYYNNVDFANTMDNLGRYKVVEERAPKGCVLEATEWTFESNENTTQLTKTFQDGLQKGILAILKRGEDGRKLSGVKFRIKAAENIYAPWVKTQADQKVTNLLVAEGTVVDTLVTNEDGEARTQKGHELYLGKYYIEEIEGATGYICDQTPQDVEMRYSDNASEKTVTYTVPISNELMLPAMSVAKLADRTLNKSGDPVHLNPQTGRYVDQKVAGVYEAEETVNYIITVTNTGNVDLYDLKLEDSMDTPNEDQGLKLIDFVEEGSAHFVVPEEGHYVSKEGDPIEVALFTEEEEENPLVLLLDHLKVGDSVAVDFCLKIKEKSSNAFLLENDVVLSGKYQEKQGENVSSQRVDVPTENLVDENGKSLVKDEDHINIPGNPEARVAKIADHTTGATLEEGRYEGKKMEGLYEYGEKVDFTITVTNYGTADLYQILVQDTLEESLFKALKEDSVVFEEGTYMTKDNKEVHAMAREEEDPAKHSLILDYLAAGDSVELHLYGFVKTGIPAETALRNKVEISAEYQTGRDEFLSVPKTPLMEDDDTIGVAIPDLAIAKKADKTQGVRLKDGRYEGKKIPAVYGVNDKIHFSLVVTNTGTGKAKNVTVSEEPSEDLLKFVTMEGFIYKEGDILKSKKGNDIKIISGDEKTVKLEEVLPGDSVELIYSGKAKEVLETTDLLKNVAKTGGENRDGSRIPETERMRDEDSLRFEVPKEDVPAKTLSKKTPPGKTTEKKDIGKKSPKSLRSNNSVPKTGDDSEPLFYMILGSIACLGLAACFLYKKRVK